MPPLLLISREFSVSDLSAANLSKLFAQHTNLYSKRLPVYQAEMLNSLLGVWHDHHARVLDIGGGTGIIAEAVQKFLPTDEVVSVDVVDRYFPTLSIERQVYDGSHLPFPDNAFEAATINNVMHHIPREVRPALMREIRRVVSGPVYVKDHVACTWLDHKKLTVLDAIGNIPFKGQIEAWYLSEEDWSELATQGGYRISERSSGNYRSGLMALLFPNRLEQTMRFERQ